LIKAGLKKPQNPQIRDHQKKVLVQRKPSSKTKKPYYTKGAGEPSWLGELHWCIKSTSSSHPTLCGDRFAPWRSPRVRAHVWVAAALAQAAPLLPFALGSYGM